MQVPKKKRRSTTSSQQDVTTAKVENTEYFFLYKDVLDECIFQEPLTPGNYRKRYHHLLCWEEKEHMSILSERYVKSNVYFLLQRGPKFICLLN